MRVILDWVANHSAFDCVWTEDHREYYLLDSTGSLQPPLGTDWWDVAQLDWEGGVENGLYSAMADAMTFWVVRLRHRWVPLRCGHESADAVLGNGPSPA